MAKKIKTEVPYKGRVRVYSWSGHCVAEFSDRVDRSAFNDILDSIYRLEKKRDELAGREVSADLPGCGEAIAEIDALISHIIHEYLARFEPLIPN